MPIYEYKCMDCTAITSIFTRSINSSITAVCEKCTSNNLTRILSKFSVSKTIQQIHETNSSNSGNFYDDPSNIGRNVEKSFSDWNMEMPNSIRESIDAARDGTLPEGLDL